MVLDVEGDNWWVRRIIDAAFKRNPNTNLPRLRALMESELEHVRGQHRLGVDRIPPESMFTWPQPGSSFKPPPDYSGKIKP